jgi:cytidylate kinase
MKKGYIVAIDGPVASGKGTIAKKLAQKINALNFNSGGVYRAYAYKLLELGIDSLENIQLRDFISPDDVSIQITTEAGGFDILLEKKVVTPLLVAPQISMAASLFSQKKEFVELMSEVLRQIVQHHRNQGKGIIMEGRQIGSDVFPDADVKIFLTADLATRAKRRFDQYEQQGIQKSFQDVLHETEQRDTQDIQRDFGALPNNPEELGYKTVDNTSMDEDATLQAILDILQKNNIWQQN